VHCFDDTPIAVLVAASPDAATAIAQNVLGPILELSDHERDTLLDTFETWLHCAGSINDTATQLFCHPNTIRYRLRKLTEHTGRPFEDPAATSELNAALQAWRLLGNQIVG
jgi:DNA-binding PucR family transcriptional regulator